MDAMDGGMRGGGFGYKKAANRRGLMKRSDQIKDGQIEGRQRG